MEPVVEPIEQVQLFFAVPLPDEKIKDAYFLFAIKNGQNSPQRKLSQTQQRMSP